MTTSPATQAPQRISLTALTNGLTGQNMFLEEDEYPAYMTLGAEYIAELRPVGVRETQLAQKIIDLNWRLNTISAVENNLFHSSLVAHTRANGDRVAATGDRTVGMCGKAATWREDCDGPNAFEKLGRHEARVQRSLFKITEEFDRLQAARLKKSNDSFIQSECKAWIWYDHMLALHTQRLAAEKSRAATTTAPATPAASITSTTELLCKKAAESDPATYAEAAITLVRHAAANGLLTPEQQQAFELCKIPS